ncbi:WD repeat-containing protein 7 isoform X1 [Ixodes scapularis]
MTISSQLVVPMTLWGKVAPTHCMCSVFITKDQKMIVTGCNDGQICVWDIVDGTKVVPRSMLFGHTGPVLCLASASPTGDGSLLVSSSEAGEMSLWDLTDGRCLESTKLPYVHTYMQMRPPRSHQRGETTDYGRRQDENCREVFRSSCLKLPPFDHASASSELRAYRARAGGLSFERVALPSLPCLGLTKVGSWSLPTTRTNVPRTTGNHSTRSPQSHMLCGGDVSHLFCNGYYADVVVLDTMTLTVAFSLVSRATSDWISAMHVIRTPKRSEDIIVALSSSGLTKVWMLSPEDLKSGEALYECESKPIRCLNALRLTCCAYNQRTILVVTAKYWHIYDANDFVLLCTMDSRPGERWMGGDFISADRVCVWSDHGRGYLYQLPAHAIAESKEYRSGAENKDNPFLFCVLAAKNTERLLCPPAMGYFLGPRSGLHRVLLRGDSSGRVTLWNVLDVAASDVGRMRQESGTLARMEPFLTLSLQEAWDEMKPSPPGILDKMELPGEQQELKLTASVYLPLQGRLVVGREDGSIVVVSATQAVMLQLLYGKHHHDERPQHQLLHGHVGRVTCLLYPHHVHSRYEIAHLVSGGVDFSVCLWDLYAGTLLHRFCVHAGEVSQLLVPPNNCSNRVLQSVCSVASDHSVALVGLKERKCVMLASRHLFPVAVVKWRPFDDFMVVGCSDGSVYVWQMETGHLDRVLQGLQAEEVLSACDEHTGHPGERMTNPAVHLFRGLRHRNMAAIRHAAQRGLHHLQHHPHHHQSSQVPPEKLHHQEAERVYGRRGSQRLQPLLPGTYRYTRETPHSQQLFS